MEKRKRVPAIWIGFLVFLVSCNNPPTLPSDTPKTKGGIHDHREWKLESSDFGELNLAVNPGNSMVTIWYESYSGMDEQSQSPKFSCVFYGKGKLEGTSCRLLVYSPLDEKAAPITGTITMIGDHHFTLQLKSDPGGCWNVQHFAEAPVEFREGIPRKWMEIRYVRTARAHFFDKKEEGAAKKAYLVKGDRAFVEKVEGTWAWVSYDGPNSSTSGWMKLQDLNSME